MRNVFLGRSQCRRLCSTFLLATTVLLLQSGCASVAERAGQDNLPEQKKLSALTQTGAQDAPLKLCKMQVSNAPRAVDRKISRPSAIACLNGVPLLIAPAPGACLTSGFGPRGNRLHKGIDFQSKPAGNVVAAAPGKVMISGFRQKDFGNWIVLDHGAGVYSAYAHLATIHSQISKGAEVSQGQVLGVMGKTGPAWIKAIHLHYEIRQGDMAGGYFGLEPVDPFDLPGSCPPS